MSEPSEKITHTLSDAAPPALPAHAVTLLLSYLSPLENPLPPHLLSEPLQQRHHFLALGTTFESAEDAANYISWPSTEDNTIACIVKLLSELPPANTFDPSVTYLTKYSFDGEAVYAHTFIPPSTFTDEDDGLRLVFRWEGEKSEGIVKGHDGQPTNADGWKFHDAKPMSFPSLGLHSTPQLALHPILHNAINQIAESRKSSNTNHNAGMEEDEDDYWNSYGQSSESEDADSAIRNSARSNGSKNDLHTEDAYWARYATVHGSADSTIPSPPVSRRKLHDPSQPLPVTDYDGYTSNALETDRDNRMRYLLELQGVYPSDVLSPEALTNRLYALSPRLGVSSLSLHEEAKSREGQQAELDSVGFESSTSSHSDGNLLSPEEHDPTSLLELQTESSMDAGLRDTVKGLFQLWSQARQNQPGCDKPSKEEFLRIVQDSIC